MITKINIFHKYNVFNFSDCSFCKYTFTVFLVLKCIIFSIQQIELKFDNTVLDCMKVGNLLKIVLGEGFLSAGGSDELDEILKGIDISNKAILDIGCGCGGAAIHFI